MIPGRHPKHRGSDHRMLLHFMILCSMCAFQFKFSSMWTPRYIADSWMAIFLLSTRRKTEVACLGYSDTVFGFFCWSFLLIFFCWFFFLFFKIFFFRNRSMQCWRRARRVRVCKLSLTFNIYVNTCQIRARLARIRFMIKVCIVNSLHEDAKWNIWGARLVTRRPASRE